MPKTFAAEIGDMPESFAGEIIAKVAHELRERLIFVFQKYQKGRYFLAHLLISLMNFLDLIFVGNFLRLRTQLAFIFFTNQT
ncbi:hypothetical protein RchiOBHm_Chr1g0350671 [Rosa chinensis]|uniref:Uncharacterized protein n=1 Tax=Rosa chinensis TaxID=74649 RepID=A0A2P6SG47_ROSCH|nr:hypothetical protein RchiOBHm_Chr1g0350671 [Rosa chinensis]